MFGLIDLTDDVVLAGLHPAALVEPRSTCIHGPDGVHVYHDFGIRREQHIRANASD